MFSSNESKGDPFSTRAPLRSVWGSNQKAAFYLRWTRRVGLRTDQGHFCQSWKYWIILANYGKFRRIPKLTRLEWHFEIAVVSRISFWKTWLAATYDQTLRSLQLDDFFRMAKNSKGFFVSGWQKMGIFRSKSQLYNIVLISEISESSNCKSISHLAYRSRDLFVQKMTTALVPWRASNCC